jgi:uncharacterized protein DUF6194
LGAVVYARRLRGECVSSTYVTQEAIRRYVITTFERIHIDMTTPDTFFFFELDRKFPFATIVTRDNDFDNVSHLDRPDVFRLNVGIGRTTFASLFGPAGEIPERGYDYAALDRVMPHPKYHRQYWVSVLNPSSGTFRTVEPLLAEAYEMTVRRNQKRGHS